MYTSPHLVDAVFLNTKFPTEPLCRIFLGRVLLDLCHIVVPQRHLDSRDTFINEKDEIDQIWQQMRRAYRYTFSIKKDNRSTLSIRSFSTPNFPPYPYDALGVSSFCFTCSCSTATLFLSSATLAGRTGVTHTDTEMHTSAHNDSNNNIICH